MAPLDLEGNNLGEKHRTYNKLFKDALAGTKSDIDHNQSNDIVNLMKIDIACQNRDIEYIISIFKSQDILYVIRAVEKSTWLIRDSSYAHIINVAYLQDELFPEMTGKAKTKLMRHIKIHLKDETRVEEFYSNETDLKLAIKWLPNCSVAFIENNVHKHLEHINPKMLKRLCEKSFTIFEKIIEHSSSYHISNLLKSTSFLLRSCPQKYFEVFDKHLTNHRGNKEFNAKNTEILMKNIPNQIIDNFLKYCRYIHVPTFVKFIKRENIKGFLLEQVKKSESIKRNSSYYVHFDYFLNYKTITTFIRRMSKNEQFNFVKEIFIDQLEDVSESSEEPISELGAKIKLRREINQDTYTWYEFAPFGVAFTELKAIMQGSDSQTKHSILTVLIKCLDNNMEHVRVLLKYFIDKHGNDPMLEKYHFIRRLLSKTDVFKYDNETWNILDLIFKNMNVYAPLKDKEYSLDVCVESIILYKVIRDDTVPEIIEQNFSFTTFENVTAKLEDKQNEKLFNFLFRHLSKKIEDKVITNEEDFEIVARLLENMLDFLKDWKKDLSNYPSICNKIKELVKIKESNLWKANLSYLYNAKKSWRKLFFEESISIYPCEDVCINALKFEPQLLTRHNTAVEKLRCSNTVTLQRVNRKLRIYWPQTLATEWNKAYLERLDNAVECHKALIRGLFFVSPTEILTDLVKKYTPKDAKINWSETSEMELSMQRNISLNMYLFRPQPNPDMVLGYAKGDFLKYALPSVNSIFYNLNIPQSREYIPKLLSAPVSLQKHGIRFAFMKLKTDELKEICSNLWKNSKNATIRKVLIEFTYKLLCNDKNASNAGTVWELLQSFIDNLSYEEDKSIYALLPETKNVPTSVKGEYFVKVYTFLRQLLENTEKDKELYQRHVDEMISATRNIVDLLPDDFMIDMIQQLLDEKFYKVENKYCLQSTYFGVIPILTAYLLTSKNLEEQTKRYEKVFLPILKKSFTLWDDPDKNYIQSHIQELLKSFSIDLKEIVFQKKSINPYEMFVNIQNEITKALSIPQNYFLQTKWNLIVAFTKIMQENPKECDDWDQFCSELAPIYGADCLEYLKQEVTAHFPRIYILFSKALRQCLDSLVNGKVEHKIYKSLLKDDNFIPGYLAGINLLQGSEEKVELSKVFSEHPSVEVKMHFHCLWNRNPLNPEC